MNTLPVLFWRGSFLPLKPITIFVQTPDPKDPITAELTDSLTTLNAARPEGSPVPFKVVIDAVSHMHTPKQQIATSDLCVKLSQGGRNYAIITLCDHFIRGIMTAVAQTPRGSAKEGWLMKNVVIVMVTDGGLTPYNMDAYGNVIGLSVGDPLSDILDGGALNDNERFYAGLYKRQQDAPAWMPDALVVHDKKEDETTILVQDWQLEP